MAYKLLKLPDVKEKVALSSTTIYRLVREGKFPRPIRAGEQATAWIEQEIDEWIELKINDRDKLQGKQQQRIDK